MMICADRPAPRVPPRRRRFMRDYVMMFRAGACGLAKRVEFQASDESEALALALAERACGAVDIIENGEFLLRICLDARDGEEGIGQPTEAAPS